MFENLSDEINNLIEDEGRDLKYRINDKLLPLNFDCTPSISYDYLFIDAGDKYSFLNPEMNQITSEEYPDLSDSQIYFKKIREVCNSDFNDLKNDRFLFTMVNPNVNLKEVAEFIFSQKLQPNQIPSFIEIKLYTNKNGKKAPRIFGFIGNANIIYVLFYDPFHEIYNKTGKI
jgi:hypothetical protein